MSLTVVATPIGNMKDVSLRALEVFLEAELVIGEEKKETLRFMKAHKLTGKPVELLNEHSDKRDLEFLLGECKTKKVVLVSDCGTPGFCDPGADLVRECRKQNVSVTSAPGASSLMCFLSLCGKRLDQFLFRGFISPKTEERAKQLAELKKSKYPVIIMDTPYRMLKLLRDVKDILPKSKIQLGMNFTQETEAFLEGTPTEVYKLVASWPKEQQKCEFLMLIC